MKNIENKNFITDDYKMGFRDGVEAKTIEILRAKQYDQTSKKRIKKANARISRSKR